MNQNGSSLTHYGVKGMRWGVRKDRFANRVIETNRKHYTKQYEKYLDRGKKKGDDLMTKYGQSRIKETNKLFDKAKAEYDRTKSFKSVTDANRYAESERRSNSYSMYKKVIEGKTTKEQQKAVRDAMVGYQWADYFLFGLPGYAIGGSIRTKSINKRNAARKDPY